MWFTWVSAISHEHLLIKMRCLGHMSFTEAKSVTEDFSCLCLRAENSPSPPRRINNSTNHVDNNKPVADFVWDCKMAIISSRHLAGDNKWLTHIVSHHVQLSSWNANQTLLSGIYSSVTMALFQVVSFSKYTLPLLNVYDETNLQYGRRYWQVLTCRAVPNIGSGTAE